MMFIFELENKGDKMCKCHKYNKTTGKFERVVSEATLRGVETGELFRFPFESFKRVVIQYSKFESYCPPVDDELSVYDERGWNVFHHSAKVFADLG